MEKEEDSVELEKLLTEMRPQAIRGTFTFPAQREEGLIGKGRREYKTMFRCFHVQKNLLHLPSGGEV